MLGSGTSVETWIELNLSTDHESRSANNEVTRASFNLCVVVLFSNRIHAEMFDILTEVKY